MFKFCKKGLHLRVQIRKTIFRFLVIAVIGGVLPGAFASDIGDKACVEAVRQARSPLGDAKEVRRAAYKSIGAFNSYMNAMKKRLIEREFLVDISTLALLSEEHLLLMGPPGNAKSLFADTLLGNIHEADGRASYFRLQMTPETTLSETHGPLDFKTLNETGRYVRILEEGMLLSRNVFIDEIFDARANALRNILGMLNERAHAQGVHITKGYIETAIAATNKYISEVYEKAGDDGPKAVLDRFAFGAFVPGEFEKTQSYVSLIRGAKKDLAPITELTFDQLENFRALVTQVDIPEGVAKFLAVLSTRMKGEVEALEQSSLKNYKERLKNGEDPGIPYRSIKYHSPRTLGKAAGVLKAAVVADWIQKGAKRRLVADLDDVEKLQKFFTLNGPSPQFVSAAIERTSSPHERAQLIAIQQEREIFQKHYQALLGEVNQVLVHFALHDLQAEVELAHTEHDKLEAAKKVLGFVIALDEESDPDAPHILRTGKDIGYDMVRNQYRQMLDQLLSGSAAAQKYLANMKEQKLALIEAKRRVERQAEEVRQKEIREEENRVAAEKAQQERLQRAQEERMQTIIASLSSLQSVWSSRIMVEQTAPNKLDGVLTTYDAKLNLYGVIDPQIGMLKIVNLESTLSPDYEMRDIVLDTNSLFEGLAVNAMHFVDASHILFMESAGTKAFIVDVKTNRAQEIILAGDNTSRSAYHAESQRIMTISKNGHLKVTSLTSPVGEKIPLTFRTTEIENSFNTTVKNLTNVSIFEVSKNGKTGVFMGQYYQSQLQVNLETGEVFSASNVMQGANADHIASGVAVFAQNTLVITNTPASPIEFKVLPHPSSNPYQANHMGHFGIELLEGTDMILATTYSSRQLLMWNTTSGTVSPLTVSGLADGEDVIYNPMVLPDGRLIVLVGKNGVKSWTVNVLQ